MWISNDIIRMLQKEGVFEPTGTKEETKIKAAALCKAAEKFDRDNGVEWSSYAVARDALGYYVAVQTSR